jgi:hypothetical protein
VETLEPKVDRLCACARPLFGLFELLTHLKPGYQGSILKHHSSPTPTSLKISLIAALKTQKDAQERAFPATRGA